MNKFTLPTILVLLRKIPFHRKLGILERLFGKQLKKAGVVWAGTSAGPIWKLDLQNHTHRWIVYGDYEGPGFIRWAKKWVRKDSIVVDSGANIGQVLLYLAPKIKTGTWIAVEPHPMARKWLKECLQEQDGWRVRVEPFGLGEHLDRCSMSEDWGGDILGSHTHLQTGTGDIPVMTLDYYARKNFITKIRLWKLDMEGGEEAALRGAEELFRQRAIEALVMETDEKRFPEAVAFMQARGFSCYSWDGTPMMKVPRKFFGNVLFLLSRK